MTRYEQLRKEVQRLRDVWYSGEDVNPEAVVQACQRLFSRDKEIAEAADPLSDAAPDMLAALQAMVLNDTHTYRDCHKAAVAAVAKATGAA